MGLTVEKREKMEKAMAPQSSTLAWKIPWTEEPGGLQSIGSLRVRHDWATSLSRTGEGNGNPLQCSCLENPRDRGAWWAAVYGVAQSWTRLKRLSSSSSNSREKSIYECEDRCKKLLNLKNRRKQVKKTKGTSKTYENIKKSICLIRISKREERRQKKFQEITAKVFPN